VAVRAAWLRGGRLIADCCCGRRSCGSARRQQGSHCRQWDQPIAGKWIANKYDSRRYSWCCCWCWSLGRRRSNRAARRASRQLLPATATTITKHEPRGASVDIPACRLPTRSRGSPGNGDEEDGEESQKAFEVVRCGGAQGRGIHSSSSSREPTRRANHGRCVLHHGGTLRWWWNGR
jgi:hypothetical protein